MIRASLKRKSHFFSQYVFVLLSILTDEMVRVFKGHVLLSSATDSKYKCKTPHAKIAKFISYSCRDAAKCLKRKKSKTKVSGPSSPCEDKTLSSMDPLVPSSPD